jgi:Uma2 family endonuclease
MSIVVDPEKLYTPEDLLLMEDGGRHYDLIDGRLVERHLGTKAGLIEASIIGPLAMFVRTERLGWVLGPSTGYQVFGPSKNNVRFMDGSFVARGRLANDQVPKGHMRIHPDLAVEAVSPNDLAEDVETKIEEYLQVGVRLLWVAFANTRRIMVYRAGGNVTRLTPTDELSGEDVVPGFRWRVEEVFFGV